MRIVSLAPSITETIYALRAEKYLVGVTEFCNYPAEAQELPQIGGFISPSLRSISDLKPTIVLATTLHRIEKLQPLVDAGIQVEFIEGKKLLDAPKVIEQVANILELSEFGRELASDLLDEINRVTERKLELRRISVCYLCTSTKFCGHKPKCQTNELVRMVGGLPTNYDKKRLAESILESNPELIVIPYDKTRPEYNTQLEFIRSEKIFAKSDVVRNGKVFFLNGELLSRPGPRAADGLHLLFDLVHYQKTDGINSGNVQL